MYCAIIANCGSQYGFKVLCIKMDLQFCKNAIIHELKKWQTSGLGIIFNESGDSVWKIRHDEAVKL